MHPLDSARLKVERANVHIQTLERSINRLLNPKVSIRKTGKFDNIGDVVTVTLEAKLQEDWPLIIGDILANLRASLDYIAWELAIKNASDRNKTLTPEEEGRIVFPLRRRRLPSKDAFIGGLNCNDVCFFPPAAHVKVEEFQPYYGRNRPKNVMLGNLKDLANWDKHRIITPAIVTGRLTLHNGDPGVTAIGIQKKHETMRLIPRGTGIVTNHLKPKVTPSVVVYPRGEYFRGFDVREFAFIHNFIRDEVIPAFSGFF